MAITNTPVVLPDGKDEPRRLNRKERRANLAKANRAMRAWGKKGGGTSVAPPPKVEPEIEAEAKVEAEIEALNEEAARNQGVEGQ